MKRASKTFAVPGTGIAGCCRPPNTSADRLSDSARSLSLSGNTPISGARAALLLAASLLATCDPSPEQKAQWAEARRIECLDKICEGDVLPPHDVKTETVFKINGQWLIAPRQYAKGFAGLAFYWPSRTPITGGGLGKNFPEFGHECASVAVEILLHRHDGVMHGPSHPERLQQAEAQGRLISKSTPRADLEVWQTQETDRIAPEWWYVATSHVTNNPDAAIVSCRKRGDSTGTCTTGFV